MIIDMENYYLKRIEELNEQIEKLTEERELYKGNYEACKEVISKYDKKIKRVFRK